MRSAAEDARTTFQFANSVFVGEDSQFEQFSRSTGAGAAAVAISSGGNLVDYSVDQSLLTPNDQRIFQDEIGLLPLQEQGGLTPTMPLNPLDYAVDLGISALAVGPGPDLLMRTEDDEALLGDQRGIGFDRIVNGVSGSARPDAGAFEIQTTAVFPTELVVRNTDDLYFPDKVTDIENLSLREAIQIANLVDGEERITFDDAIHGQTIHLTEGRALVVRDELVIQGTGADQLTIDAEGVRRHFVWLVGKEAGMTFRVDGLKLINGTAPTGGGSIWANLNEMILSRIAFENNESTFGGGAVYASQARLVIANSSFVGNHANANGGAVAAIHSDLSLLGVTASNNSANERGGALYVRLQTGFSQAQSQVLQGTFLDNTAAVGADVAVEAAFNSEGDVVLGNSVFASIGQSTQSIVDVNAATDTTDRVRSLGHNIVVDGSLAGMNADDRNQMDPVLGALMVGVGGIAGHHPLSGSPALDNADPALLPADVTDVDFDNDQAEALPIDLFGGDRRRDLVTVEGVSDLDIGAVEANGNLRLSSENGVIGVLRGADNFVVTGDRQVLVSLPSELVTDVTLVGTPQADAMVLADLTGHATRRIEDAFPIVVEGLGGYDSLVYSTARALSLSEVNEQVTTKQVENLSQDSKFDHETRLTPSILHAAIDDPGNVFDWSIDHWAAISDQDGWAYSGSRIEDEAFYRQFTGGTVEVTIKSGLAWTNILNEYDVDGDGDVRALDALLIINAIARGDFVVDRSGQLEHPADLDRFPNLFYDVSADGRVSAMDALRVINHLASQSVSGEGEQSLVHPFVRDSTPSRDERTARDRVLEAWPDLQQGIARLF
ncbi:MAG: dockerin type I domain-containing protein [Planctomycetota bacterium]